MSDLSRAINSSIGMKIFMALSGIGLVLFVIVHMAGNLQMFIGPEAMNAYAAALKEMPLVLWGARLGLITIFVVHIIDGIRLKVQNKAARPVPYAYKNTVQASVSSRTMIFTGIILLVFVIYHLLHFTLGVTNPEHFQHVVERHDVYSMVVLGFQNPIIAAIYILAMLLLSFHLSHGTKSFFQSLGINHPKFNACIPRISTTVTFVVIAGFISVPVGVLIGIIQLPKGGM